MQVSQFLFFDGDCRQAMTFYQSCLGGELTLSPVAETHMAAAFPASMHSRIINARLVGNRVDFSACDWMRPEEQFVRGNMNCMYLSGGSREETKRIFDALSENANVTDPINALPFGYYGALNDQFGVRWMFHAE
jgi:PhnB protein